MRKFRIPLIDIVSSLSIATIGIVMLLGILSYRVAKLQGGVATSELQTITSVKANTIHAKDILTRDSLFLPYKAGLYGLEKAHLSSVTAARFLSVLCGVAGAAGFYFVIRGWHTRRISLMSTFLFVSSSLFLYTSRFASPAAMYLLTPWLIYFGIRLQRNNLRLFGLVGILLASLFMLYVPGLIWFIVPAAIWQRQVLKKELLQAGRAQAALLMVGGLVLILPLLISLGLHPELIKSWLGWTASGVTPLEFCKNLVGIPVQLFIRSDFEPLTHVGRLPYLDIATAVLIALGIYWYFFLRGLDRTKLLLVGLAGGIILSALNINALPILLPYLYLLAGAGITLLLQQWFTVFPRNPLARNIGVGLLTLLLAFVGYYHMHRYFVAWPHTPETKQAYSQRI